MEAYGKNDLLRELNAMQEKMGSSLDYWDGERNRADDHTSEAAESEEGLKDRVAAGR